MRKPARQVVTVTDVRNARGTLRVAQDAIVTPLAADAAMSLGIRIERISAAKVAPISSDSAWVEIASRIDHTRLNPDATTDDIARLCHEAIQYRCAAVCVSPTHVRTASSILNGQIPVCAVVGFPTGAHRTAVKVAEAAQCVGDGAGEVDMVAAHGLLKSAHYECYAEDIGAVRAEIGKTVILKVIIEAPLLTQEATIQACALAAHAGADFIKTSTGVYAKARTDDVHLMRRAAPSHVRIKAAGGIRTLSDATLMIDAGADRIGASATAEILREAGYRQKSV